jgi:heat shock protein HslJ
VPVTEPANLGGPNRNAAYAQSGQPQRRGTLKTRRYLTILLSILGAGLLAACGHASPTPAPATAAVETVEAVQEVQDEMALLNTGWQAESFGGAGDTIPVIPDTFPSLHFMAQRYNGFSGCNYFVGVYGVDGDSLRLETPAITEGGCNETDLVNQDATYTNALWDVSTYKLTDGKLLLYDYDGQLMITMVPIESLPFEETLWDMKFLSPELSVWQPLIAGTAITAKFDGEQISGSAGCNEYSAPYTRTDNAITVGELTVTDKTCDDPEGVMDQETLFLSMLPTATVIGETARSIELTTGDDEPLFMFHGVQDAQD